MINYLFIKRLLHETVEIADLLTLGFNELSFSDSYALGLNIFFISKSHIFAISLQTNVSGSFQVP